MIPQSPIQSQLYQKFPDYKGFIEHFKPANLIVLYDDINTIEESISEVRISIQDINTIYPKQNNVPAGIDYLSRWIDYLQDFLNINNRLTKIQDVAAVLYKDHRHFYLSDLALIFQGILRSEYGRFYGSVDSQTIITSFGMYNVNRFKSYLQSDQKVRLILDSKIGEMQRLFKQQLYDEIEKEGKIPDKKEIYIELEKRFNERFPLIYQEEYQKLMKETPRLKSSQE